MMTCTGTFRIYFNRMQAAPLVWCVAKLRLVGCPPFAIEFEIAVPEIEILVPARTHFQSKTTADSDDGIPSAWIEVTGKLVVESMRARIEEP